LLFIYIFIILNTKWEKVGNFNNNKKMLIGEYIHTIDSKNRVSVPFKFRQELGKKLIITPGLDNCLFIFSQKEWLKVVNQLSTSVNNLSFLKADKRNFNRYMFGRAAEVSLDKIGRILIPDFLKNIIKAKEKVVLVGVEDRVEIWNLNQWQSYQDKIQKDIGQLAEKLGSE
jgi:MraZ protein